MQYMYVVSHPWGASFPILFYTYQYPGMCYFNLPSYCCLLTRIVHAKKNNWQRLISSFRWSQSNALLLVQHFLEALFRMIPNCFYSFFFCELKEEHFSLLRFFFSSVSLSFFFWKCYLDMSINQNSVFEVYGVFFLSMFSHVLKLC